MVGCQLGCQLGPAPNARPEVSAPEIRDERLKQGEKLPAIVQLKNAYYTLVKADEARDNENFTEAMELYREALHSYVRLSRTYPDWQPGAIRFQITYCNNQLEAVLKKMDMKILSPELEGTAAGEGEPDLEAIKSTAKLLLKKEETAKARSLLLEGLRLDPDDKTVRLLMGIVHCQAREFENAVHLLEQLVKEDHTNANAHIVLGTAYFGLGRFPDAREEMERAMQLDPDLNEAHYNLTQILLATTPPDLKAARYHYKRALDLGSEPDESLEFLLK